MLDQSLRFGLLMCAQLEWKARCCIALQKLCVEGGNKVWQVNRGHFLKEGKQGKQVHAYKHTHTYTRKPTLSLQVIYARCRLCKCLHLRVMLMNHPRKHSSNKLSLDAFSLLLTKLCIYVCLRAFVLTALQKGVRYWGILTTRQSLLCHLSLHKNNCTSLLLLTVYCL